MVTVYPRLSDAELEALPSRTEASIYRNAYEIACWLKERHDAVAEPGEYLPSSQKAVAVYTWKRPQDQWPLLQRAIAELEQDGLQPQDILPLTPFKVANSQVLQAQRSKNKNHSTTSVCLMLQR